MARDKTRTLEDAVASVVAWGEHPALATELASLRRTERRIALMLNLVSSALREAEREFDHVTLGPLVSGEAAKESHVYLASGHRNALSRLLVRLEATLGQVAEPVTEDAKADAVDLDKEDGGYDGG